jgi:capsular polysaccharide biosynthesis protein
MDTIELTDSDLRVSSFSRAPRVVRRPVLRRLADHWWRILLLWLVMYTLVAYVIWTIVEPTYEAFSLLEVQPTQIELFKSGKGETPDLKSTLPYLQTQVEIITSDPVLDAAVSQRSVAGLPMVKKTDDPKAYLREKMTVKIVGNNTYLIRVALESTNAVEAAAIVSAVVDAYTRQHTEFHQGANKTLKANLQTKLAELDKTIKDRTSELGKLVAHGFVEVPRPSLHVKAADKDFEPALQPSLTSVTEEQFVRLTDRLIQADLELLEAQARLETAKLAKVSEEKLRDLEASVENAKKTRIRFAQYITRVEVKAKPQRNNDTLEATLDKPELENSMRHRELIREKIEQLEFETNQEAYRVLVRNPARAPKIPTNNKRLEYLAIALGGVLFLLIGLFLVQEIKA